jgi:hypothetical protein
VEPVDGGTRVCLVHRGLQPAEIEGHAKGWTEMLDRVGIAASEHDTD